MKEDKKKLSGIGKSEDTTATSDVPSAIPTDASTGVQPQATQIPQKSSKKGQTEAMHAVSAPPTPEHTAGSLSFDSELRGRTLLAYLFILRSPKPIGVRELQRSLGLSSPSVAYHHLDKLTRLGLIEKDQYGEYTLVKNVNVGVLQAFTQVGRLLVPRFTFYAVFFTTLLLGYIVIFLGSLNPFALAFGLFASAFAWYETLRTWKKRPF
ncbi:MAG TPA: winged helix-turn-helix domain-containing protein [Nitrososphaerales archaeon]|nr:winged helix-turn-helix domain-containing protein [Nitrososphaerales archaeon]